MIGRRKTKSMTLIWGVTVLILFTFNLSGIIYYNGSNYFFDENRGESTSQQCDSMRCYVIEGAGYFLQANSDFLSVMNVLETAELNGLDVSVALSKLDKAICTLLTARSIYEKLKKTADLTPYNMIALQHLFNFDYEKFQVEHNLNEPIFKQVEKNLCKGQIREIYGISLKHIDEIMAFANLIKVELEAGRFPELVNLFKLNEAFSHSLLFGQYAARVFQEIN